MAQQAQARDPASSHASSGGLGGCPLINLGNTCYLNASIEGMCVFRSVPIMSRGLGWRIHESVEDTKLSTNKQHSLSHTATRSGKLTRRSVSASAFPRGSRALFMPFPLPPLTPCSTPAFWLLPSFRNSASDGWDLSANGGAQGSTGSRFTCITASSMLSKSRRSNIPSCEGSKRVVKYVQKMNYGLGRTGLGHENKQYCTSQSARDARNPHKATAPHLFVV